MGHPLIKQDDPNPISSQEQSNWSTNCWEWTPVYVEFQAGIVSWRKSTIAQIILRHEGRPVLMLCRSQEVESTVEKEE